jgi:hypothetical protein
MKKIVLKNVPPEIARSIKRKALNEDLSREEAVVAILRDAEINWIAEREIARFEEQFDDEECMPF